MFKKRLHPTLSQGYVTCARTYALDIASSLLLFFCTSVMTGRVRRFPFDDELSPPIEGSHSALELLSFYLSGGDIHPPLSFLLFYGLRHLGLTDAGLRICSLAMTALALALIHLLALTFIAQRNRGSVALSTRLIAVLLFGLSALAISQGDAIRWYPLFAMLIALFLTLYLAGGETAQLLSAVPLGLAASTNFLAILVAIPLALYRYGLQRKFRASFEATYWLIVALFACLGFYSAYSIFVKRMSYVADSEFSNSAVRAVTTDVLGFFGGCALGISQAWVIVPAVVISVVAMFSLIDRKQLANPVHLLLLILFAPTLIVLPGFATPRSFLYLAPVLTAVLVLFLDRQVRARNARIAVALASLILAASVGAIVNINNGTHPFKRNSVIPYQSIIDFIESNEKGRVLVVSTDIVIPWVLQHQHDRDGRCVSYFFDVDDCLATERHYDSIFVIVGHSDRSASADLMRKFNSALDTTTAGRRKAATVHFGVDEDAEIKSRLTGVPLDKYILTVDLYQ